MLPTMRAYVRSHDDPTKQIYIYIYIYIYFLIEDDNLLKNYNTIWDIKVGLIFKNKFGSKPVCNKKILKIILW